MLTQNSQLWMKRRRDFTTNELGLLKTEKKLDSKWQKSRNKSLKSMRKCTQTLKISRRRSTESIIQQTSLTRRLRQLRTNCRSNSRKKKCTCSSEAFMKSKQLKLAQNMFYKSTSTKDSGINSKEKKQKLLLRIKNTKESYSS